MHVKDAIGTEKM